MSWLRVLTPWRTDDEISAYVIAEVEAGRIKREYAPFLERSLRDEAAGRCVIMRNPNVKPRPPRSPGQQGRRWNGAWWHH